MSGLESLRSSESGALGSMIEHKVQMADGPERISVKHRKCWGTLFSGRFTRLTLFSVAVNHGSTLEFSTIFGAARGAKAAAEAGKRLIGIVMSFGEEDQELKSVYIKESITKQADINHIQRVENRYWRGVRIRSDQGELKQAITISILIVTSPVFLERGVGGS